MVILGEGVGESVSRLFLTNGTIELGVSTGEEVRCVWSRFMLLINLLDDATSEGRGASSYLKI